MDNGYGMFVKMLEYKQRERGHLLVKVDKWYPYRSVRVAAQGIRSAYQSENTGVDAAI